MSPLPSTDHPESSAEMFKFSTIAFLYPGAMGSSLARTLHLRQPHLTLLTSIGSRSPATHERAKAAGLVDVPLPSLIERADVIISILPPSAAVDLATSVAELHTNSKRSTKTPLVYIDANAIAPGTVSEVSEILTKVGIKFIDGCVIGLPAREGFDPKLFLSADASSEGIMRDVGEVLGGGAEGKGLRMVLMDGAGEGAASALKMCYGGINKGLIGLMTSMILTAHAHSPATADALLNELSQSRPTMLGEQCKFIPDMVGKAYRWVGEFDEIASFISSTLSPSPSSSGSDIPEAFTGMAQVFQRVADDQKPETGKEGKEVKALLDWAEAGKKILEKK